MTHRASISEADFDGILPLPLDDDELAAAKPPFDRALHLKYSPYVYHVISSQVAVVMHRFSKALRRAPDLLERLVRDSNDQLAIIKTRLPYHLQSDVPGSVELSAAEGRHPWIRWQRLELSTLLLHCRILVNRQCRWRWNDNLKMFLGPRNVCMESARSLISILSEAHPPLHQRRYS